MKKVRVNRPRTPAFERALKVARESAREPQPICLDDPSFVDYSSAPSRDDAEEMCIDCPLYFVCRESAKIERPAWGVRGGIAWDMGRQVHWVKALRAAREAREEISEEVLTS